MLQTCLLAFIVSLQMEYLSRVSCGHADALTEEPSWGRIGLYLTIALFMSITAAQEVKYLQESIEAEDK